MSSIQSNKEVIRKLYEQALNGRNMALLPELISEEFVGIRGVKGAAGFEIPILALRQALPDVHWSLEELVGEGDKVMVRWQVQGTHTGPFQHVAATGKTVGNDGMAVYTLKEGKVIETQVLTDRLGFLQALEVLPLDLSKLPNPTTHPERQSPLPGGSERVHPNGVHFIDKFFVPEKAKQEFTERMNINRNFIKTLPGFIEDTVYEQRDEQGNLHMLTIAVWGK